MSKSRDGQTTHSLQTTWPAAAVVSEAPELRMFSSPSFLNGYMLSGYVIAFILASILPLAAKPNYLLSSPLRKS